MTTRTGKRRLVDPDDLAGIKELAERLSALGYHVERSHITTWISRRNDILSDEPNARVARKGNGFPEPFVMLAATGVYSTAEVLEWVKTRYPDPKRNVA